MSTRTLAQQQLEARKATGLTSNSEIYAVYRKMNGGGASLLNTATEQDPVELSQEKLLSNKVVRHIEGSSSRPHLGLTQTQQTPANLPIYNNGIVETLEARRPVTLGERQTPPPPSSRSSRKRTADGNFKHAENTESVVSAQLPASLAILSKSPNRKKFSDEEDLLIVYLKEILKLPWKEIQARLPYRSQGTLSTHYCIKLDPRKFAHGKSVLARLEGSAPYIPPPVASPSIAEGVEEPPPGEPLRRMRPQRNISQSRDVMNPESSYNFEILAQTRAISIQSDMSAPTSNAEAESEVEYSEPVMAILPRYGPNPPIQQVSGMEMLPYLSAQERFLLHDSMSDRRWDATDGWGWNGTIIHCDFQNHELLAVGESTAKILNRHDRITSLEPLHHIQRLLKSATDDRVYAIAAVAKRSNALSKRTLPSIISFLMDVRDRYVNQIRSVERFGRSKVECEKSPDEDIGTFLRHREIGRPFRRHAASSRVINSQVQNLLHDTLGPSLYYIGTSGDVNTVAWSPNGETFAAGSASLSDTHSMQYNRPRNLLLGNVRLKTLIELPDHHVPRPIPETGANASHAMYTSQDPRLFSTISMVAFSHDGRHMFSAGFQDKYLRVWDVADETPRQAAQFQHKQFIDVLAVSKTGLIATGSRRHALLAKDGPPLKGNSLKVISLGDGDDVQPRWKTYGSDRADKLPELEISPSTLKFEPIRGQLLLAGFSSYVENVSKQDGDICVWDAAAEREHRWKVNGSARHVFDCAWSPLDYGRFAVGSSIATGDKVGKDCHSLVRIYDFQQQSQMYNYTYELECPAMDINDVVFCPYNSNYVAAGCTSGSAFIWDLRMPDQVFTKLNHQLPIQPYVSIKLREEQDTGIRFCSWGQNATRLYTGSSDGLVRVWDITKAWDDQHIKDIASLKTGIMSGAFSPDYSSLIIGEVGGAINVLDVGNSDKSITCVEDFHLIEAPTPELNKQTEVQPSYDDNSGISIARDLLETRQIVTIPLGNTPIHQAVQGPEYDGPYDSSASSHICRLKAKEFQDQIYHTSGESPCSIPTCKNVSKVTFEDVGDSGRSTDRIPHQLRQDLKEEIVTAAKKTARPGFGKCNGCGIPARARSSHDRKLDDAGREEVLCERCNFSCFRCGGPAVLSNETDVLWCLTCDLQWTVDALGYSVVPSKKTRADVDMMRIDRGAFLRSPPNSSVTKEGAEPDEMNDLVSYYHSLWIDRPASPL